MSRFPEDRSRDQGQSTRECYALSDHPDIKSSDECRLLTVHEFDQMMHDFAEAGEWMREQLRLKLTSAAPVTDDQSN